MLGGQARRSRPQEQAIWGFTDCAPQNLTWRDALWSTKPREKLFTTSFLGILTSAKKDVQTTIPTPRNFSTLYFRKLFLHKNHFTRSLYERNRRFLQIKGLESKMDAPNLSNVHGTGIRNTWSRKARHLK